MDLVGFDETVFRSIADEIRDFAGRLGLTDVTAIPVSALGGDNVVERSTAMAWFDEIAPDDPRRNAALPDFIHNPAASLVTLGRFS